MELIYVAQGKATLAFSDHVANAIQIVLCRVGRPLSLSTARNIGIAKATGDIVAFPDDDCWYDDAVLEKISGYFEAHPQVECICVNVYDPELRRAMVDQPIGVIQRVAYSNVFQFANSNGIFIRRNALRMVGDRFDERLGVGTALGSGEETEFVTRLLALKIHIDYVGTIQVYHPVIQHLYGTPEKEYSYSFGFGVVNGWLIRRRQLGAVVYFLRSILRSCLGAIVYSLRQSARKTYANRALGMLAGVAHGVTSNPCEYCSSVGSKSVVVSDCPAEKGSEQGAVSGKKACHG